ncbi:MAG: carbamoyltransferase N-terminal domain-containing protein, partial [Candidatus Promineifilaceae bacterium]|nr:carbamoyltransferase N-terminal domain-containing protein [Candidatus Promineifilaceae bacterium]
MNIVGLSAFYHESACCLLQEGRLVAAAAEERFTRIKHDPRLPVRAFRYCLEAGGLSIADVDCIAYYESPVEKLARQLWAGPPRGDGELAWLDPGRPLRAIGERLGYDGPVAIFRHHESHAASAFFYSGFEEAAILTVDGVGEWATTTYGHGRAGAPPTLELLEEVHFPHSLGLLYATITAYLGFRVNSGEYKVMGLAAHGRPRYVAEVERLLEDGPGGQFRLDMRYFDFLQGQAMYAPALCALFGRPPRRPDEPLEPFHRDVACSVQAVLEAMLLRKVRYLAARVPSANLCMAGGVALNCVANGRLLREGPFARLFVQPAAGDAGGCLGAAALAHTRLAGGRPPLPALRHVYLGPAPAPGEIAALVAATGLPALDFRGREGALLEAVADRLAAGKVVGWFQGRMEFGPRALGARSILASPLEPEMQERLNAMVKKRERFRPFAPSVLLAHAAEHFAL